MSLTPAPMLDALLVIALTGDTVDYLAKNDPQALKQVLVAIEMAESELAMPAKLGINYAVARCVEALHPDLVPHHWR